VVPVVTILAYVYMGNLEGLDVAKRSVATDASAQSGGQAMGSVEEMVAGLAERLAREPDDVDGWRLLARSYVSMERYPDAVQALRRARGIVGDDPGVLLELAGAIARNQGGNLGGQPTELLATALHKAPDNPRALYMAGQLAATQGDFNTALKHWRRLDSMTPADSKVAPLIKEAIAEAQKALSGEAPQTTPQAPVEAVTEPTADIALSVHVALDPDLANQVDKTDTVFVYAQALSGPPMPLAVTRKQVSDLPLQVTLNDTMAMMPTMKLSKFKQVRIAARISKSGNAIPQSGDFQVKIAPIAVTSRDTISLVIRDKIP
jgi:cytochrome c-type biogenesis protein CcmH